MKIEYIQTNITEGDIDTLRAHHSVQEIIAWIERCRDTAGAISHARAYDLAKYARKA